MSLRGWSGSRELIEREREREREREMYGGLAISLVGIE